MLETKVVPVQTPLLKDCIQYFIFFKTSFNEKISYRTFPNTNLCLAIYKQNKIDYVKNEHQNICEIKQGGNSYSSRLFGFHESPFEVYSQSCFEQVCILFHPAGLRAFTNIPYQTLQSENNVFDIVFDNNNYLLDQVFDTSDIFKKAGLLQDFLLKKKRSTFIDDLMNFVIHEINAASGDIKVETLAEMLGINSSTLYRKFNTYTGQNPKDFIQTVRFRAALSLMSKRKYKNLTDLTYHANYYDQSHLIKDFKRYTGEAPHVFQNKVTIEDNELTWIVK